MFDVRERPRMVERALLVGVRLRSQAESDAIGLLDELESLAGTLGVPVVGRTLITVPEFHAKLLMGSGKAEEVKKLAGDSQADVLIFDNELTPGQQRNWEELAERTVIDRQEVIIDIFAQRAHTREARLQVDLARMEYSLPRLKRAWGHLDRQGGGIGARGEGETQLETDRRLVRRQIERLKAELQKVRTQRATQRKKRQRVPLPIAAIVGYTNAGKSSLLRRLTGAPVLVEDKLFATLDPTTRRLDLPGGQTLLLTDTVGFIRALPHHLVDAFRATLEESLLADFLIHVVDASHPLAVEFLETTLKVLEELGAGEKEILTVFNKIDQLPEDGRLQGLRHRFPEAVFISAKEGLGIDALLARFAEQLSGTRTTLRLRVPVSDGKTLALLHREGRILQREADGEWLDLIAQLPRKDLPAVARYLIQ